jgi:hypothetical protein
LTRLSIEYEWKEREQEAFDALKEALATAPVLCKPDFDKEWILEVDASNAALGAVLSQKQSDGTIRPTYFWSKQLNAAERNYSTTDRECLAVVAACKKFRPYILGIKTTIIGDHTAVRWLFNKIDVTGRHARWKILLSEYDYEITT